MFESCHVQSRIPKHTTRDKEIVEAGLIFLVFIRNNLFQVFDDCDDNLTKIFFSVECFFLIIFYLNIRTLELFLQNGTTCIIIVSYIQ